MDNKPALAFEAAYGSLNYGLQRPESDDDRMYFYYPTFTQLIQNEWASDAIEDSSADRKHHDVRKVPGMFNRANPTFIEILFAQDGMAYDGLLPGLRQKREQIAAMNLPYLFDSSLGMYDRQMKNLERDAFYLSDEEIHHPDLHQKKMGKSGAAALRILDVLFRYHKQGFADFGKAIFYDRHDEHDQLFISMYMAMRDGHISYIRMKEWAASKRCVIEELRKDYKAMPYDEATMLDIETLVNDNLKRHIRQELAA